MKRLLILVVLLSGCKKKDTPAPEPVPTPISPPTSTVTPTGCVTGLVTMEGKYVYDRCNKDTITIKWKQNACPEVDRNYYIVSNYYRATNCIAGTTVSPTSDFWIISTERENGAHFLGKDGTFFFMPDGRIELRSIKLKQNPTYFKKVQ